MKAALSILYSHAIVIFLAGITAFAFPAFFVDPLAIGAPPPGLIELAHWYAVPLMLLSGVLLSALLLWDGARLRALLRVYLLGDLLQIAVTVQTGVVMGFRNPLVIASLILTVLVAPARLFVLRRAENVRESGHRGTPFRSAAAPG